MDHNLSREPHAEQRPNLLPTLSLFPSLRSKEVGSFVCFICSSSTVELVKFEAFFMSERASLFLSSIGLLGEYCPTSRKKNRRSSAKVGCMHLGLIEGHSTDYLGCQFMQPFPTARNLSTRGGFLVTREHSAADFCSF